MRRGSRHEQRDRLILVGGTGDGDRVVGSLHDVGRQREGALQQPGDLVAVDVMIPDSLPAALAFLPSVD